MNKIEIYFSDEALQTVQNAKDVWESISKIRMSYENFVKMCIIAECTRITDNEKRSG